jgi:hypothetical protein
MNKDENSFDVGYVLNKFVLGVLSLILIKVK